MNNHWKNIGLQDTNTAENCAELGASELSVLLPCPFCGDDAWLHCHGGVFSDVKIGYRVECEGECHAMTCYWHTKKEAQDAWNKRAG